ncbi:uncharacterized protein B0I36DRAFT_352876 [Microdochium trichocladiopsis]|uniref:Uncharacterized protein n=1 Tax=Microdochium trichocladiopsis TaxID=1682393 RepID=A0A9P8XXJ1_9PEZI|nr:uncharacterized protein B0I36DRAFT_352876 [Microdochium trichocladiopsis]KAH7024663.1 hypothetical protein B0I36DRAFT_352876 [Microdochium trichocladiopsis]
MAALPSTSTALVPSIVMLQANGDRLGGRTLCAVSPTLARLSDESKRLATLVLNQPLCLIGNLGLASGSGGARPHRGSSAPASAQLSSLLHTAPRGGPVFLTRHFCMRHARKTRYSELLASDFCMPTLSGPPCWSSRLWGAATKHYFPERSGHASAVADIRRLPYDDAFVSSAVTLVPHLPARDRSKYLNGNVSNGLPTKQRPSPTWERVPPPPPYSSSPIWSQLRDNSAPDSSEAAD